MSTTELLLIRHGESVWNAQQIWQGHGDPSLTARGRAQADELAKRLCGADVTGIVSSDLARARETADVVATELRLALRVDPRLRELDVGRWSGLPPGEIERLWPDELARFRAGDDELRAGGGESRRQLRTRALEALREIITSHPGPRVAVVTHAGLVCSLLPEQDLSHTMWCRMDAKALAGIAP